VIGKAINVLTSPSQVILLLFIAHVIIHAMWKYKIDPDSSSIPYLTALGDLIGSSLLMLAFVFLRSIGHKYEDSNADLLASSMATSTTTTASVEELLLTTFGAH